jgi:nucleotide-binding universal stress UspA family protein
MSEPHFAVASTFSPRFESVIAEADCVARLFGARLSVLHAGTRSDEKVALIREAFVGLGREEIDIYWCDGEKPATALMDATVSEYFDLLIVGAISDSGESRNFTGGIVRELFTRTPCDLLLIPNPQEMPIVNPSAYLLVEAHSPRWKSAIPTLRALNPSSISILAADSPFAQARRAFSGTESEVNPLDEIQETLSEITPDIDLRRVQSNTGFILCDIIQDAVPDFILVESEWKNGQRVLPPYLGWLEQIIPSRLFVFGKPPREVSHLNTPSSE